MKRHHVSKRNKVARAKVKKRRRVENTSNNASKEMVKIQDAGESFNKRSQSLRLKLKFSYFMSLLFIRYPNISNHQQNENDSLKKKRTTSRAETPSLKTIYDKLMSRGFISNLDLFKATRMLLNIQEEDRNQNCVNAGKFLDEVNDSEEIKNYLNLCCTQYRTVPARSTGCNVDGCDLLIEIGRVNYESVYAHEKSVHACHQCYRRSGDMIKIKSMNPSGDYSLITLPKVDFVKMTYGKDQIEEPVVQCIFCRHSFHKICVMYDEYNCTINFSHYMPQFPCHFKPVYVCKKCIGLLDTNDSPNDMSMGQTCFNSPTMYQSKLSEVMESDLADFLFEMSSVPNPKGSSLPLPAQVRVRIVYSSTNMFEAKPRMKQEFLKNNMPTEFKYIERSIMIYQEDVITKQEIVLFNVIFQEFQDYGYLYISYLDSIRLFRPEHLRSSLFKQVIISYLKSRQAEPWSLHPKRLLIWVCPPKPGDEYVFYGRPSTQPSMGEDGLKKWYNDLLKKCIELGIVDSYEQVGESNPYGSYLDIPYILEDFWQDKLEEILHQHELDQQEQGDEQSYEDASNQLYSQRQPKGCRKPKKNMVVLPMSIQERVDKVIQEECHNNLFVVKLKENKSSAVKQVVLSKNEEPDIKCRFMSTRDNFLISCRANCNDFSDARRAAYTTSQMHSRMASESLNTRCTHCDILINKGLYCYRCKDVYLCKNCTTTHEHRDSLKKFVVPFRKPKECPQFYLSILKQMNYETIFLKNFITTSFPTPFQDCLIPLTGVVLVQHINGLNLDLPTHDAPQCPLCHVIWPNVARHKQYCKGQVCNIPSCAGQLRDEEGFISTPFTSPFYQPALQYCHCDGTPSASGPIGVDSMLPNIVKFSPNSLPSRNGFAVHRSTDYDEHGLPRQSFDAPPKFNQDMILRTHGEVEENLVETAPPIVDIFAAAPIAR